MADSTPSKGGELNADVLAEVVRRVVEVAAPDKIILFGSAARGEMGPHSDIDLLIVKDAENLREITGRIYRRLYGVGAAVDAIMVTPGDVARYRDSHALIIKPALQEGRVVYGD